MKLTYSIILFIFFLSNDSYSQKKISSSRIKGHWMIKNDSNEFYNSDTLTFFKKRNPDKSVPLHHWKRPFLETKHLLNESIPRVNLDLSLTRKVRCSEVSYDKDGSSNHIHRHRGKWKMNKSRLEIKSEYHYNWHFKIKKVEKIKFTYNGKNYKTLKMSVIKKSLKPSAKNMKSIIFILTLSTLTLNLFSQGNYVFENGLFDYLNKNKKAKIHNIKSINYYPNFVDSLNKGECVKKDSYNSSGNIIKEEYLPNSSKSNERNTFIYDTNGNLKEMHGGIPGTFGGHSIFHLDYYETKNLRSIIRTYPNNNSESDTLTYYYTNAGLFEYKTYSNFKFKMFIRYNSCGKIEYIETLPLKPETIKLNDDGCVIYSEIEMGDDLIGKEKSFSKITYNSNCQSLTNYTQYYFGDEWNITSHSNQYNSNSKLVKTTSKQCWSRTKKKCLKKFGLYKTYEYIYDTNGLILFEKVYNKKGKLTSNYFYDYKFH